LPELPNSVSKPRPAGQQVVAGTPDANVATAAKIDPIVPPRTDARVEPVGSDERGQAFAFSQAADSLAAGGGVKSAGSAQRCRCGASAAS
jgi:hypothetical protein